MKVRHQQIIAKSCDLRLFCAAGAFAMYINAPG